MICEVRVVDNLYVTVPIFEWKNWVPSRNICLQGNWHLRRYFNPVPADHETGALTVLLQHPFNREVSSEGSV